MIIIPTEEAQETGRDAGEVTREAVKRRYDEATRDRWRREFRDGDLVDVAVLVGLESPERERVEEAAAEVGEHPAEWLAEATAAVVEEGGPVARPGTLADQVERAVFNRTTV